MDPARGNDDHGSGDRCGEVVRGNDPRGLRDRLSEADQELGEREDDDRRVGRDERHRDEQRDAAEMRQTGVR